jgi:tRNA dimethylallyltransferase
MPILFALVGATGVGKSRLSLKLAERFHAEIIGVDSRQIYKDFAIGTAQPSKEDMAQVPHHLINFCSPARAYSAGDFCSDVKDLLLHNPEKNFVLVGGTGLYLQALTLGLPRIPAIDSSVRENLEKDFQKKGLAEMCALARTVDSEAMDSADENNPHRILRILEVWQGTGRKLSEWKKEREGGIGEVPVFWLTRSRKNLYARINARVDQMVQQGWIDEVQELSKSIPLDAPAWQSLGYRELLGVQDPASVETVLEEVKKKTRNYAKRQITWFSRQVDSVQIDLDECCAPAQEIIDKLTIG